MASSAKSEGAKQGAEIAAQEDFMTVCIEAAGGSLEVLKEAMGAAQEAAGDVYAKNEGRKRVGMMFVSSGAGVLAITASVPPERHAEGTSAREWVGAVIAAVGGQEVEGGGEADASAVCKAGAGGGFTTPAGATFSQAEALGFEATKASVAWLRGKGLFPPKEEEGDEDDFIPEW